MDDIAASGEMLEPELLFYTRLNELRNEYDWENSKFYLFQDTRDNVYLRSARETYGKQDVVN